MFANQGQLDPIEEAIKKSMDKMPQMVYEPIIKMNPNHDEKGRFSAGDSVKMSDSYFEKHSYGGTTPFPPGSKPIQNRWKVMGSEKTSSGNVYQLYQTMRGKIPLTDTVHEKHLERVK